MKYTLGARPVLELTARDAGRFTNIRSATIMPPYDRPVRNTMEWV